MLSEQFHVLRLFPGQDLRQALQNFIDDRKIKAGWIVTCVGSLTDFNIRFANASEGTESNGYFEILSLAGTVSSNGSHLHICIADGSGKSIGGHLLEGCKIYTTAEIILCSSSQYIFTREKDLTTGWAELHIQTTN